MPDPKDPGDLIGGGSSSKDNDKGGSHETIYGDGSHISWDRDSKGDYVRGSGHTRDHSTGRNTDWDR